MTRLEPGIRGLVWCSALLSLDVSITGHKLSNGSGPVSIRRPRPVNISSSINKILFYGIHVSKCLKRCFRCNRAE